MVHDRIDMLYAFDKYVKETIGDEIITDIWLTEGLPDEADTEELTEIAEDDFMWLEMVETFAECCRLARVD